jgi:type IV pilus assembly protein PilA
MSMTTIRSKVHRQAGFSLIEVLIVILVLGLLMAIAVPSFLGARRNGQNSQAQSSVRSALSAERTHYIDYQQYTTDQAALRKIESNLTWNTTDATQNGVMAAVDAASQVVVLVSTSKSGSQFCIMNIAQDLGAAVNGQTLAGTYYAKKDGVATAPTSVAVGECGSSYSRSDAPW